MTHSFFYNLFVKAYQGLMHTFDKSMAMRFFRMMGRFCVHSAVLGPIIRLFTAQTRNYAEGSLILRLLDRALRFLGVAAASAYAFLGKTAQTGLLPGLAKAFLSPVKNLGDMAKALGFLGLGFFVVFFGINLFLNGFTLKIAMLCLGGLGGCALCAGLPSAILEECIKGSVFYKLGAWFFANSR